MEQIKDKKYTTKIQKKIIYWQHKHVTLSADKLLLSCGFRTIGPFIRGKIRRELYHLYEHVLSKTRTARVLFLFLTRFHVNVARSNSNPTSRAENLRMRIMRSRLM